MAANLEYYREQAVKILYQKNKFTDFLAQVEQKTQVKREYVALGEDVTIANYCHVFLSHQCPA